MQLFTILYSEKIIKINFNLGAKGSMQTCEYYMKEDERKVHKQEIPLLLSPPLIFQEIFWYLNPDSPLERDNKGDH